MNGSSCDEANEELIVPGCDFTLSAQRALPWSLANEVVGHVLERGEVGGRVILPYTASPSRKIMSSTSQCRLFSTAQWPRMMGPIRCAASTREVM